MKHMLCHDFTIIPPREACRLIVQCLVWGFILLCIASPTVAQQTIGLAWDWNPGKSGFKSGPGGDIVFAIYMRTGDENEKVMDNDPVLSDIDECTWDGDHYRCQATLEYDFEPGFYHFVAVAYLAKSPEQKSPPSNEATYVSVDSDNDSGQGH